MIVLQLQQKTTTLRLSYPSIVTISWRNVILEDLSIMSLNQLIKPREGDELPTCFRPGRTVWGSQYLILQILEGGYSKPEWRDAKLQDLNIKDGQIQGGLGLIARSTW